MTFEQWLAYGVQHGFCSEQFCDTHDGGPMTEAESAVWDAGFDPCRHMVRLGTPKEWDEYANVFDVKAEAASE